MIQETKTHCANCGHQAETPYCPKCGQRKQTRFTPTYIWGEVLAMLNYDKGIIKNFFNLSTKPTATILSYLGGKTNSLYPPLSYFFTAMTFFLVFVIQFLEPQGWSSGKTLVFDAEGSKAEIRAIYAKEKKEIEAKIHLADTIALQQYYENPATFREGIALSYKDSTKKDSIILVAENFSYTKSLTRLLNLAEEEKHELETLDKKVLRSQVFIYTIFYFTPFYLACITFLLYFKKKFYFTEHLIIQMFITSQLIAYLTVIFAFFKLVDFFVGFFHKDFALLQTAPMKTEVGVSLWVFGVFFIIGYYFQVSRKCYKQSWWLVLLKCFATAIILLVMAMFFLVIGNNLITGERF